MKRTFATIYTPPAERSRPSTDNQEPSLCETSHARECDINVIMSRYERSGQLPQVLGQPLFGDFTEMPDYRQAVTQIQAAEAAFLEIPAKTRALFGNDPAEFIKFCSNPENREELDRLGLLAKPSGPTLEEQTLEALRALKPTDPPPGEGVGSKTAGKASPAV